VKIGDNIYAQNLGAGRRDQQVHRNRHLSAADFTWQGAGEEMGMLCQL
jgi:hypothetical protein